MPGGRGARYQEIMMQPLFEKEIMMKQRYRVEAVMASSRYNNLKVPRDVMDVLCEQDCSSLQIPEIIERLTSLAIARDMKPQLIRIRSLTLSHCGFGWGRKRCY